MTQHIQQQLQHNFDEIVSWRRYLHEHPELSFEEAETAAFIRTKLDEFGIPYRQNVGGHGIVARIEGAKPGKTIAFRADFDALPITDEKEVPYKSTKEGVMHACGHDGHTSALLGFAKAILPYKDDIHGTIVLIFQPAEEKPPGGAKFMIEDGALDGVDYIFGAHLATEYPLGKIATKAGAIMASVDAFKIKIQGRGGHGARPHQTIDAVAIGSRLVGHLQQIVSRRVNPIEPAVVTVGKFQAGNTFNIIADTAELEGTVRALNQEVRELIEAEIRSILEGMQVADHITYELDYTHGYPVLVNHEKEAALVETLIKTKIGHDTFIEKEIALGAEDFAYYLQHRPGAYFYVGAHTDDLNTQYPHHHPKFDFDERALLNIAKVFVEIANYYVLDVTEGAENHVSI